MARRLADVDVLRALRREVEQLGGRQAVVHHDVGEGEHLGAPPGQEAGITGAGAHEVHGHAAIVDGPPTAPIRPSYDARVADRKPPKQATGEREATWSASRSTVRSGADGQGSSGDPLVAPRPRRAVVHEDVDAAGLGELERWRVADEAAAVGPAGAGDQHPVAVAQLGSVAGVRASWRWEHDFVAELVEEGDRVVAGEEPGGERPPPQGGPHLDAEADRLVGRVPGEVAPAGGATTTEPAAASISTPSMRKAARPSRTSNRSSMIGWMCSMARWPGRVHVVIIVRTSGVSATRSTCSPVRGFSITVAVSRRRRPVAADVSFVSSVASGVLGGDAGLVERGHLAEDARRGPHEREGEDGAGALAEAEVEVEQRVRGRGGRGRPSTRARSSGGRRRRRAARRARGHGRRAARRRR